MNLFGTDDKIPAGSHGMALDCFCGPYPDAATGTVTVWLWLVGSNLDNGNGEQPVVTLQLLDDSNPAGELGLWENIVVPNEGALIYDCASLFDVPAGGQAFSIVVINNGPGLLRAEAHKQSA